MKVMPANIAGPLNLIGKRFIVRMRNYGADTPVMLAPDIGTTGHCPGKIKRRIPRGKVDSLLSYKNGSWIRELQRHSRVGIVRPHDASMRRTQRVIVDTNMQRGGAAGSGRVHVGPDIRTGPKCVGPVVAEPYGRRFRAGVSVVVFDPKRATT